MFLSGIVPNKRSIIATVVHIVAAACTFAKNSNNLGEKASSLYLIVPFQDMRVGAASVREPVDLNNAMTQQNLV